jgi:hypothetical protein
MIRKKNGSIKNAARTKAEMTLTRGIFNAVGI